MKDNRENNRKLTIPLQSEISITIISVKLEANLEMYTIVYCFLKKNKLFKQSIIEVRNLRNCYTRKLSEKETNDIKI